MLWFMVYGLRFTVYGIWLRACDAKYCERRYVPSVFIIAVAIVANVYTSPVL